MRRLDELKSLARIPPRVVESSRDRSCLTRNTKVNAFASSAEHIANPHARALSSSAPCHTEKIWGRRSPMESWF